MLARDLVWNCPSDEECAGLDNYLFELVTVGQHALLNELSTKLSARSVMSMRFLDWESSYFLDSESRDFVDVESPRFLDGESTEFLYWC